MEKGEEDALPAEAEQDVQASLERAVALLKCAEADLQGILPEFEPSGDRTHPAWKTLAEIGEFLKECAAADDEPGDDEGG